MKFTKKDKKQIEEFYQDKIKKFGIYSPKTLGWIDEFTQFQRFKVLTQVGDLKGKSILDVGCGLGDLYFYLKNTVKDFHYLGIDILPEMINKAKIKYPKANFKSSNFSSYKEDSFNYVLASGLLFLKIEDYKTKYFQIIKQMYNISNIGVAFNMLNKDGHPDNETFAAYDSDNIEKHCKKFASKVKVIKGYLPQDFTIYLYH